MQISFKQSAWFSDPERLAKCNLDNPDEVRNSISMVDGDLDMTDCGWIKIGVATTVLEVEVGRDELTACAVSSIDKKITETRAEFEVKLNALTALKQSFLAIEG